MKQDSGLIRFVVALLFVVILIYLGISALRSFTNSYQTVLAYTDTYEDSLSTNGWIFRQETVLAPVSGGPISYAVGENEKVGANQTVAVVYKDETALSRQQQVTALKSRLLQLNYAMSDSSPQGGDLDKKLLDTMTGLRSSWSSGGGDSLSDKTVTYRDLILRREYLSSDQAAADIGKASIALAQNLTSLQSATQTDYNTIIASASGIFSSHTDGYEQIDTPDALNNLTVSSLKALTGRSPADVSACPGKLVTAPNWYYVILLSEEDAGRFIQNSTVNVRFSSLADTIPMLVSSVGGQADGQAVVVLTASQNLADVVTLRQQTGSVIFSSSTGIRVPKGALRVLKDGTAGVYTVTGYTAEFKPATILAEGKDYYLLAANPSSSTSKVVLRAGDEVILTSADLYDGKVVR